MSEARVKAVPKAPMEVAKQMAPEDHEGGHQGGDDDVPEPRARATRPRDRAASSSSMSIFSAAAHDGDDDAGGMEK